MSAPTLLLLLLTLLGSCALLSSAAADQQQDDDAAATTIFILSDRPQGLSVVMSSTCSSAADPSLLRFRVITSTDGAKALPPMFKKITACAKATLAVETVEEATEQLRQRGFHPFWATAAFDDAVAAAAADGWGVRTPYRDAKHAAPLNHLRFYLPQLLTTTSYPETGGRFMFMDDDIVVQTDVTELSSSYTLAPTKAMGAGCQHWHWSPQGFQSDHHTTMIATGYMGAHQTDCAEADAAMRKAKDADDSKTTTTTTTTTAAQMKKLERQTASCTRSGLMDELEEVDAAIDRRLGDGGSDNNNEHDLAAEKKNKKLRGLAAIDTTTTTATSTSTAHPLDRTAFNLGFNIIDAEAWEEQQLTQRYEAWVAASVAQQLFPPDTLAFGLVLSYLALGDAVQCYDDELTHLVGLGFIPQERLEGAYGWTAKRMAADADALHYNGKNKPWDAPMPRCADVDAEPKTALDIWHQHCGPEFCPCDDDAETDGGANGDAARRRLEEEGSEYTPTTEPPIVTDSSDGEVSGATSMQASWPRLLFAVFAVMATTTAAV